jgi:hypothetical protein
MDLNNQQPRHIYLHKNKIRSESMDLNYQQPRHIYLHKNKIRSESMDLNYQQPRRIEAQAAGADPNIAPGLPRGGFRINK